jgi:hypothetical protein
VWARTPNGTSQSALASHHTHLIELRVGTALHRHLITLFLFRIEQVVVLLAPSSDVHFGGAVCFWAHPKCTVLVAEPVRFCGGGTIGCVASFESGPTVLLAKSACGCFCGTTKANARGLCVKHGGSSKGVCVYPGCTTKANARGLCVKHGGSSKGVCVHPGCTTKAQARRLCAKHGGCRKGVRGHPGCTTKAAERTRTLQEARWNHFQTMPRT